MHIGGLAVVVPGEAITHSDHLGRYIVPAENVAEVVNVVDSPVGHLAVAPVPLPMPVVVELLSHHGCHRSRAGPEIVVDVARNRLRRSDFADRLSSAKLGAVDPLDLAVLARLDIGGGFLHCGARAMLRAGLHNAFVLAGGIDHLAALGDRVADRLFHVYILAGLAGIDGHERMPVIGGRNYQSVDVFAI